MRRSAWQIAVVVGAAALLPAAAQAETFTNDVIINGGYLGVNTTPSFHLHAYEPSTGSARLRLENTQGYSDIYSTAGGELGFKCNTEFRMTLTTGGFVGINTRTPGRHLHIFENSQLTSAIRLENLDGAADIFCNRGEFGYKTNGLVRMTLDINGLLGIGTRAPEKLLHLHQDSTGTPCLRWSNGSGQADISFSGSSLDMYAGGALRASLTSTGRLGIGTASPTTMLDVAGEAKVRVLQITGGSDLSERFEVTGAQPEPGMVVSIDPANPGELRVSAQAYDRTVAGIVSGAGGINTGMMMGQENSVACGGHPVALTGRVYCLADAADAAIAPGDLLTTSNTPGHAMKAADAHQAFGAILGKAMTPLAQGETGLVLVLVSLQ